MRHLTALLALVVTSLSLVFLASTPASAVSPMTLASAVTDNYKPKWNADPTVAEKRTWFQLGVVTVGGVTYRPTTLPAAGNSYSEELAVTGSNGSTGYLTVSTPATRVQSDPFRTMASGEFGPLLSLTDPTTLRTNPVPVTLRLVAGGTTVAEVTVTYTWDEKLATVAPDHVEYKSPGGRFWIGCTPTRTDWETSAPPATCTTPTTGPDLRIAVSSPSHTAVGNSYPYTVTVTNAGAATAAGVTLTDVVPHQLRVMSVVPGAGITCSGASTVTCSVGSLAAGGRASVTIGTAAVAPGAIVNEVSVSSSTTDTNPADNTASRTVVAEGFACTVIGTPSSDVLVAPSSSRAVLCGLGGADTLTGQEGNDQLYGGDGNDQLSGGPGNDVLTGGPGDDDVDGGSQAAGGVDRISFADARSSMVVNMGQLHAWDDGAVAGDAAIGYDAFTGVEGAIGSPFADQMLGGAGNDWLEGVGGNDTVHGYGGSDLLDGGVGADSVYGQSGSDTLRGHNGNDRLSGGTGADVLDGQLDTDTCTTGGNAGDTKLNCEG